MKELLHVEQQIKDMHVMPDFGYTTDNYLLDSQSDIKDKWRLLTGLLEDPKKFQWLMNFVKYKKIEASVKSHED